MNKEEIQNIIDNLANSIFNTDWIKLLDYIKNIEKENQQLKKQKDDVVEYLGDMPACLWNEAHEYNYDFDNLLRMLGEIDNE